MQQQQHPTDTRLPVTDALVVDQTAAPLAPGNTSPNIETYGNVQNNQEIKTSPNTIPVTKAPSINNFPKISSNFDKHNAHQKLEVHYHQGNPNSNSAPKDIKKLTNNTAPPPHTFTHSLATKLRAKQAAETTPIRFTPPKIITK